MAVLRKILPGIAPQMAELTNAILENGTWPEHWKTATVRVIWKKRGSIRDPKMYRPISILPTISRVVERLVERRLRQYLEPFLPAKQHGFRAQHGCTSALAALIKVIANARAGQGGKKAVVVASLDATAAFDTVDHGKLLEKLQNCCGVTGKALALIKSYLSERKQRVKMKGERYSNTERLGPYGVPQWPVLAPLLYTTYTMDLPQHIKSADVVLYADDCTLVAKGDTLQEARENMTKSDGRVPCICDG
eukprot:gene19080-biopygen14534